MYKKDNLSRPLLAINMYLRTKKVKTPNIKIINAVTDFVIITTSKDDKARAFVILVLFGNAMYIKSAKALSLAAAFFSPYIPIKAPSLIPLDTNTRLGKITATNKLTKAEKKIVNTKILIEP